MATLTGNVIRGDGFAGVGYGIPTANIFLSTPPDLGFGTYAATAEWGDKTFEAMMYYGANDPKKLEVHLFDFTGDLYGTRLSMNPLAKISEYVPWTGEEAMRKKVADDVNRARVFFETQKYLA